MPGNNPKLDLVYINAYTKFDQILPLDLRILSRNKILILIKRQNCYNLQKMTANNPNLNLVNINAYTKFGKILSICSRDIERKQKYDINQRPKLCYKFTKNDR